MELTQAVTSCINGICSHLFTESPPEPVTITVILLFLNLLYPSQISLKIVLFISEKCL